MELLPLRSQLTPPQNSILPLSVYTAGTEYQKPLTRLKGFSAHQLFLTISGEGRFRKLVSNQNKWDTLSEGALLFIPSGCPHEYLPAGTRNWFVGYVTFLEHFGRLLDHWGFGAEPRIFRLCDSAWFRRRLLGIWKQLEAARNPRESSESLYALLLELMNENPGTARPEHTSVVPRKDTYPQTIVETAVNFLKDHMNRSITTAQLAQYVGYSPKQLTRLFRQAVGRTPLQYLRELRLNTARKLLQEQHELNVRQIAAYVGMQPVYFTRLYKTAFRILPSEDRLHPAAAQTNPLPTSSSQSGSE